MTPHQMFLAMLMLITGSINTLSTTWADETKAKGTSCESNIWQHIGGDCDEDTGEASFDHPFTQAACMFLGELSCLFAFKFLQRRNPNAPEMQVDDFPAYYFLPPALCDLTATSIMYAGLAMSYASVFQILRGSVVVFTAFASVIFLGRKLQPFHWFAVFLVACGTVIVGLASVLEDDDDSSGSGSDAGDDDDKPHAFLGEVMIVAAQAIVACQMVLEEKLLGGRRVHPLQGVGLEGMWGFMALSILLVIMGYVKIDGYPIENTVDALSQMSHSTVITVAMLGNVVSIAFFNFAGLSVTKSMSASHRMVLDSVRTIVVWTVSLAVGWETFNWLVLCGFCVVMSGTVVYNELVRVPGFSYPEEHELASALLDDGSKESLLEDGDKRAIQ